MEAKKILNLDLDLNINNDKYECCCNNIDFILYRVTFNPYLKKFIGSCYKYNVKYYETIDNKFYIYKKSYIIDQIKQIIKKLINDHINILNNVVKNNKKIDKLNKFIDLVYLVYEYKLLNVESLNKPIIDVKYEYDNLVNLSNILGEKHVPEEIIIIDSYSW